MKERNSALEPDDRKRFGPTEKRLTEMGFKKT